MINLNVEKSEVYFEGKKWESKNKIREYLRQKNGHCTRRDIQIMINEGIIIPWNDELYEIKSVSKRKTKKNKIDIEIDDKILDEDIS